MGGWFWALFFAIAIAYGSIFADSQHRLTADNIAGEASAISGNMMVYRNAVSDYARANPTVTGSVADGALTFPTWYSKISGISNYVAAGKGYVYYSAQRPELAYQLVKSTNNTILSGIKRSGVLYNPISGTSSISIPVAIPNESVVYGDG